MKLETAAGLGQIFLPSFRPFMNSCCCPGLTLAGLLILAGCQTHLVPSAAAAPQPAHILVLIGYAVKVAEPAPVPRPWIIPVRSINESGLEAMLRTHAAGLESRD